MLKELLQEGVGINWNMVAQFVAEEMVKQAFKNDPDLKNEDPEYVADALDDELVDFIMGKLGQKPLKHMEKLVKQRSK